MAADGRLAKHRRVRSDEFNGWGRFCQGSEIAEVVPATIIKTRRAKPTALAHRLTSPHVRIFGACEMAKSHVWPSDRFSQENTRFFHLAMVHLAICGLKGRKKRWRRASEGASKGRPTGPSASLPRSGEFSGTGNHEQNWDN